MERNELLKRKRVEEQYIKMLVSCQQQVIEKRNLWLEYYESIANMFMKEVILFLTVLTFVTPEVLFWNRSFVKKGHSGYSKLTINVGEISVVPKNCQAFLNNLEVRNKQI